MNKRTINNPSGAALVALLSLAGAAGAQEMNVAPNPRKLAPDVKMQSILRDAEELAGTKTPQQFQQLRQELADQRITLDNTGKVHVEIIGPKDGAPVPAELINQVGGTITGTWKHRVEAWVPVNRLTTLARLLPVNYFMRRGGPMNVDGAVGGEGATVINSSTYRDGGADGSGKTIAVIDGGFQSLTLARNNSDAPPVGSTTQINYTGNTFESSLDGAHGTGCVEAAYDHCPGATWRLYKCDSLTDVGSAVNDGELFGVDVISHSLSWYNEGWGDNSGDACAAANDAADGSTLFFTSAGNRAQSHYQGTFNDPDGDGWHNFSGGDEQLDITTVASSDSYYMSWNTSGGTYDYDLYLYSSDGVTQVASSINGGNTYEEFSYNPGASVNRNIAVYRFSGGTTEFEIFIHNGPTMDEYGSAADSTTSPSNSTNAGVVSTGAVTWGSHDSANGVSGIIASYSSQGPSNSNMTLPDLTGPTNTNTTSNGAFGGTSCATPNNAGAACAFWSAHPGYNADAIRWLLYEQADLWKDWGAAGNDNVYGRGGTMLIDFESGTVWLARSYNNLLNAATGPYYTSQAAYNGVPDGGRILIFPGGNYVEAATMIGTKSCDLETVENNANFGF